MFSFTETCKKELNFLLLFGHFLALFTMSGGSLIDSGCSAELQRVSVRISGTDIKCGEKYPLSSVGNPEQPEFSFPSADEVRRLFYCSKTQKVVELCSAYKE